jgi:integrase
MQSKKEFKQYLKNFQDKIEKEIDINDNKILANMEKNILYIILKNLDYKKHFYKNQIYFNMSLWVKLYNKNKKEMKHKGIIIHNFVKKLIQGKFVHKNSKNFPKNQNIFCINPLSKSFLNCSLDEYDRIIDIRDNLIKKLKQYSLLNDKDVNLEFEINLFIYFKLFSIVKISNTYFKYLKRENIIYAGDKVIFVLEENSIEGFTPIHKIIFDNTTSEIIRQVFPQEIKMIFDANEYIFTKNYNFYFRKMKNFCEENKINEKITNSTIELEFQINSTPLTLTLMKSTKHPRLSLFELEKLYPQSVNNYLLALEKTNQTVYKKFNQNRVNDTQKKSDDDFYDEFDDESDDELDIKKELNFKFNVYEKLTEIVKVPKNKLSMANYFSFWRKFMSIEYNKVDRLESIYSYIEFLFVKHENNEINQRTLRNYLQISFDYCFDILVKSINMEEALKSIYEKLRNSNLNPRVQNKYLSRILFFFDRQYEYRANKISNTISYNRSIVFKDELNELVKKLLDEDLKLCKSKLLKYRRTVFSIISYYSGLRKSELYSREVRDFSYIDGKKFYINVNKNGLRRIKKHNKNNPVSLKNNNSIRAFEFEITDRKHFNIVKKYYDLLVDYKIIFLFPDENDGKISKEQVMNINKINTINNILQDITKRYTVIHSFRHSYVTNEIKKLIQKKDKKNEDMYDLIFRVGHEDPETSISHYTHLDLIKIM